MSDPMRGLYHRFDVFKAGTGERVHNYFVLLPDSDPASRLALLAYANAVQHDNPRLAEDIRTWMVGGPDERQPLALSATRVAECVCPQCGSGRCKRVLLDRAEEEWRITCESCAYSGVVHDE